MPRRTDNFRRVHSRSSAQPSLTPCRLWHPTTPHDARRSRGSISYVKGRSRRWQNKKTQMARGKPRHPYSGPLNTCACLPSTSSTRPVQWWAVWGAFGLPVPCVRSCKPLTACHPIASGGWIQPTTRNIHHAHTSPGRDRPHPHHRLPHPAPVHRACTRLPSDLGGVTMGTTHPTPASLTRAAPAMHAALTAMVTEIDGSARPYSTDSWLPHHLLDQARAALALAADTTTKERKE